MSSIEQEEKSTLKRAHQIIDAVFKSSCVVETRCFSQPDELERLGFQVESILIASLAEKEVREPLMSDDKDKAPERLADRFSQDEIDAAVIELMNNDGSIDSGWQYHELVEHHRTFEGIIRQLLNREFCAAIEEDDQCEGVNPSE